MVGRVVVAFYPVQSPHKQDKNVNKQTGEMNALLSLGAEETNHEDVTVASKRKRKASTVYTAHNYKLIFLLQAS